VTDSQSKKIKPIELLQADLEKWSFDAHFLVLINQRPHDSSHFALPV
jgi:hypothetical protein